MKCKNKIVVYLLIFVCTIFASIIYISFKTMAFYKVCGSRLIVVDGENLKAFSSEIERLSKISNTYFSHKEIKNYKTPDGYLYIRHEFGFCDISNCVVTSNDYKENEFHTFVYENSIVPLGTNKKCLQLNDEIRHLKFRNLPL